MTAPRRAGDITFYEYLGVGPRASAEEIRDAFRAMVRLLHPDQQTDLQLKEIAENQMRKLNRVYSVLSDPERRRRYDDETMEEDYGPAIVPSPVSGIDVRRLIGRAAWIAAILLSAGLLIWFAAEDSPAFQGRIRELSAVPASLQGTSSNTPSEVLDQTSRILTLQSDLRVASIERDAALAELRSFRSTFLAQSRRSAAPLTTAAKTAANLADSNAFSSAADPIAKPAGRQFAGFWFYSRPLQGQQNRNRALYPPEFIELTMWEDSGSIRGRYRSRFQVSDRAISPDVTFTFHGTANGSLISCPWTGPGGARGDLTMKLTSANLLQVDWSASERGTQQSLDSGTAVLTRRVE